MAGLLGLAVSLLHGDDSGAERELPEQHLEELYG
jgi:hypothetical protein